MTAAPDDPLWPHFRPLWSDLKAVGEDGLLVAGGYGLFLKQNWLLPNEEVRIVVPVRQWLNATPRVTKDLDIVVGLELIADEAAHRGIQTALTQQGFTASERNPRWQFEKRLSESHTVIVELHAPRPGQDAPHLKADRYRIVRKPSLKAEGIHARLNPEAVGCELLPFEFEVEGVMVAVPNPVTWSVMKLTATRDRWRRSDEESRSMESRQFERAQGEKHAQDVCRAVAMTTRDESDRAQTVVDAIRATPEFASAGQVLADFFGDGGRAARAVGPNWATDDFALIRRTLAGWFRN